MGEKAKPAQGLWLKLLGPKVSPKSKSLHTVLIKPKLQFAIKIPVSVKCSLLSIVSIWNQPFQSFAKISKSNYTEIPSVAAEYEHH